MNAKTKRFFSRTLEHIHRVQRNVFYLIDQCAEDLELTEENCRELAHQVLAHDRSKFSPGQFVGYVELTEFHHQRRLYNPNYDYPHQALKAQAEIAWRRHAQEECHHPEGQDRRVLHREMGRLQIIEMACDLQAMSEEFNEGSRDYYNRHWVKSKIKYFEPTTWVRVCELMERVFACFEARERRSRQMTLPSAFDVVSSYAQARQTSEGQVVQ